MKKLLFFACALFVGLSSNAQLNNVSIDTFTHTGAIAAIPAGTVSYRIYAETDSNLDFVTEVTGDPLVCTTEITTTTSFYRNNTFAPGLTGKDVNFGLINIPGFEDLRWGSYVTIGYANSSELGIPFAEDASGTQFLAAGGAISTLGAWTTAFAGTPGLSGFIGGNIDITVAPGGSWFALNGDANGYGIGVNNSVLLGQFTTDGDFAYNVNISVIPDGAALIAHSNCNDSGTIDNMIYPEMGCTNALANNYNSFADEDDGSCILGVDGCTDSTACNYDSTATNDDGSCESLSCAGCTDSTACNYDFTATIDDGSCESLSCAGCTDSTACNYDSTAIIDDASCDFSCYGCTSASAINYDSAATLDDGSCIEPGCADAPATWNYCYLTGSTQTILFQGNAAADVVTLAFNAGTIEAGWDNITFYDGADNTAAVLAGPLDGDLTGLIIQSTGLNLTVEIFSDASVSCESGAAAASPAIDASLYCAFEVIAGCTDATAVNYDANATADCLGVVGGTDLSCCSYEGCTDTTACNFDANAQVDDGSCEFTSCAGCTDSTALNYDATATIDDASCIFATCADAPTNWSYCYLTGSTQSFAFTGNTASDQPTIVFNAGTIEAGWDNITFYDGADNTAAVLAGPLDGDLTGLVVQASGQDLYVEIFSDASVSCDAGSAAASPAIDADYYCSVIVVPGCTDSTATNYNAGATVDDGSCIYPPSNDDAAAAEALDMTFWPTCTNTDGTTDGSSDSPESAAARLDVWYSIVPVKTAIKIEVSTADPAFDGIVELYDAGYNLLFTEDAGVGGDSEIFITGVTPGDTYFINVAEWAGTQTGAFSICAQNLPQNSVSSTYHDNSFACNSSSVVPSAWLPAEGTVWYFNDGVNPEVSYATTSQLVDLVGDVGLASGTTYTVHVNSIIEGFEVPFSFQTTLTLNGPTSALKGAYRNATVDLIPNAFVRCVQGTACDWQSFDWRITDEDNNQYLFNTTTDLLRIDDIPGVTYDAEYVAEVAVVTASGTEPYGTAYSFFTGSVPQVQVEAQYSQAVTLLSPSQWVWSNQTVIGATDYEWAIQRTDEAELGFSVNRGSSSRNFKVSNIPLQEGGTYEVQVRPIVPGSTSVLGPVVVVEVLGGAPVIVNDEDGTTPVALEADAVKDEVITAGITMFPNPAKDFVTLNITDVEEGTDKVLVDIFNSVGQLVQSEQIAVDGNYVSSVVTFDGLAEGMYNVQITVGNTVSTERMIIQK